MFRDRGGRPLYVGKATDLRGRVRSYFSSDDRRKTGQLLREATTIDHVECRSPLEASVLEVRLIHQLAPRFNRHLTRSRRYVYLKLTDEPFPRLAVARVVRADRGFYLGPLGVIPCRPPGGRGHPDGASGPALHRARSPGADRSAPLRALPPSSAWPLARARARTPSPSTPRSSSRSRGV